jgi:hypothetical protein
MQKSPGAQSGTVSQSPAQRELTALSLQRSELRDQLRQLSNRRNQLSEQMHVSPDGGARRSLQERLGEIDQRTARIDAQIQGLDERISTAIERTASASEGVAVEPAKPAVPAIPAVPGVPPFPEFPDFTGFPGQRPEYLSVTPQQVAGALVGEALVFVLIGVAFWRLGWKRMRHQLSQMSATQGTQLDRVQQAVDVIAVEVERIAENQRFVSKLLNDRALGAGAAEPLGHREKAEAVVRAGG